MVTHSSWYMCVSVGLVLHYMYPNTVVFPVTIKLILHAHHFLFPEGLARTYTLILVAFLGVAEVLLVRMCSIVCVA